MPRAASCAITRIAIVHVNHELVINTFVARIVLRHFQARAFEQAAVFLGDFAALLRPGVQATKFDAQHGALKSLHAVVVAREFVVVARGLSVGTRRACEFRDAVVVGGQRAAFTVRAEVFRGIKAERGRVAERSDALGAITRGMRLRRVLQDAQVAPRGDFADGIHVRGAAVEMHGKNGASTRGDGALDETRIQDLRWRDQYPRTPGARRNR